MRLGFCLVLGFLALAPGLSEESPPLESAGKAEVKLKTSKAEAFRERFQEAPPCRQVPKELFHPAPAKMKELVPPEASLAGAGALLAVLIPELKETKSNEGVYRLRWFENHELLQEQVLEPTEALSFHQGAHFFEVSPGGKLVAFQTAAGIVVFSGNKQGVVFGELEAKGARFALSDRELIWCMSPQGLRLHHQKEAVPLCYRGSLKNASSEELFVLDEKLQTLGPQGDLGQYVFLPTLRRDGKFWFVNSLSGEVRLTSAVGSEMARWVIPYRIETNPEVMSRMQQMAQQKIAELEAKGLGSDGASGGQQPRFEAKIIVPLVIDVASRDNELVILTTSQRRPPNAVFWLSEDLKESRCFLLPELSGAAGRSASSGWRRKLVVTDDALWIAEPLGYYLWDELLSEENPSPENEG